MTRAGSGAAHRRTSSLFDLNAPWRVDRGDFRSKSSNTPFDGRPVQGRVLRTVVDGRTVFAAED